MSTLAGVPLKHYVKCRVSLPQNHCQGVHSSPERKFFVSVSYTNGFKQTVNYKITWLVFTTFTTFLQFLFDSFMDLVKGGKHSVEHAIRRPFKVPPSPKVRCHWCYYHLLRFSVRPLPPNVRCTCYSDYWLIEEYCLGIPQCFKPIILCYMYSASPQVGVTSLSSALTVWCQVAFCRPVFLLPGSVQVEQGNLENLGFAAIGFICIWFPWQHPGNQLFCKTACWACTVVLLMTTKFCRLWLWLEFPVQPSMSDRVGSLK